MNEIRLKTFYIDGRKRIGIYIPYNPEFIRLIRKIQGAAWDSRERCWHVHYCQDRYDKILKQLGPDGHIIDGLPEGDFLQPLQEADRAQLVKLYHFMKFRRYSTSTIRTYIQILRVYMRFRKPGKDHKEEIIRFCNEYILENKLSTSYQNQFFNAIKLFFREILGCVVEIESLSRPRREHRLPNVLSKDEVKNMLKSCRNLKHRAMLSLIYACGLRRSELLNLRPEHIDSRRELLIIKNAKGKKDRIVPLPVAMIRLLREYYLAFRPQTWLFEGVNAGNQYDERSLQLVLKKAVRVAGIKKPVTLHWLRHSYATHLHESGVDIHMIQLILGHKSTRTTEIYTHVSNKSISRVRSPFEDL